MHRRRQAHGQLVELLRDQLGHGVSEFLQDKHQASLVLSARRSRPPFLLKAMSPRAVPGGRPAHRAPTSRTVPPPGLGKESDVASDGLWVLTLRNQSLLGLLGMRLPSLEQSLCKTTCLHPPSPCLSRSKLLAVLRGAWAPALWTVGSHLLPSTAELVSKYPTLYTGRRTHVHTQKHTCMCTQHNTYPHICTYTHSDSASTCLHTCNTHGTHINTRTHPNLI